jgi:2'-5' RNA ligase
LTKNIRRQLTLFVNRSDAEEIETIRKKFNSRQSELIDCHVTLCREDEISDTKQVFDNLRNLDTKEITIQFGQAIRFDGGKGVLIPATGNNEQFQQLRKKVLRGLDMTIRQQEPHITLMHPGNSTCTDEVFGIIKNSRLPSRLTFNKISLIEQVDGGNLHPI